MKISAKARLISIIVAVVFMFGALAGTGTYLIINHINKSNALKGGSSIGDIIDTSNRSIVNYSVYAALMDRLGSRTGGATTLENGGSAIVFTMAGRDWQVVYRDPANSDIITVWMTEPYTTSTFGSNDTYSSSTVRTTVNNYYNTQVGTYTAMSSFIRTPSQMSSTYKTAQARNGSYGGYTSDQGALGGSENFWLPSLYEAFSLWGLDNNDRGFDDTSISSYCWLRSGNSYGSDYALRVGSSGSSGSAGSDGVSLSRGVRPAAHISLSALFEAVRLEITVQANDNRFGTVSGSGEYGYNSQVTITATPNIGYVFDHWELNGQTVTGAGATYTFNATTHQTYTAIFRLAQTTITSSSGSSDIIAQYSDSNNISQEYLLHFASGRYLHNLNINNFTLILEYTSLTLTNFDFCTAIEYVVNDNATQLYLKIIGLTGDLNITLSLADLPPPLQPATSGGGVDTVAVVSTYGGSAEIVGDSFADDSQITLVARNKINGYQFIGWFVGNSSTPISTEMSVRLNYSDIQGKVITARFEPIDSSTNNSQTDNNQTSDFV